jgi:hypothetical protein
LGLSQSSAGFGLRWLSDMEWDFEMSEHKNIYMALTAAQSGMGKVTKGSVNPAFKSRYADLADVVSVVVPALSEQGIAMYHSMTRDDHGMVMRTTLSHGATDTHIHCDVPLIVDRNNMQGMKSATTYAKRIGLESLTGIAPDTDDDGNAAAKAAPKQDGRPPAPMTEHEFNTIKDLLEQTETDQDKFCQYWKVKALHELTGVQAQNAIAMLKKKAAA